MKLILIFSLLLGLTACATLDSEADFNEFYSDVTPDESIDFPHKEALKKTIRDEHRSHK